MIERPSDDGEAPLPAEWLPEPHAREGSPEWEAKVQRIMATAEPELRGLARGRAAARASSWSVIGRWWKPAAALTAAASTLLFLVETRGAEPASSQESLSLSLVAAEGDPLALWGAFGIQADPVLALIAYQERPRGTTEEERR